MVAAYETSYPLSSDSADRIVPLLLDLLGPCEAMVDLGGGVGSWCRTFKKHGCRVTCVDDLRIRDDELLVDRAEFRGLDLAAGMPAPIKADLALSLEFAEHVPEERAPDLVRFLVRSAPVVVFSASLPGQPGFRHVNEQPARCWKALFASEGYLCLDLIRPRIVGWSEIPYWYRQNMFVYASQEAAARLRAFDTGFQAIPDDFELVHESLLKQYRAALQPPGFRKWLYSLPVAVRTSWRARRFRAASKRPSEYAGQNA